MHLNERKNVGVLSFLLHQKLEEQILFLTVASGKNVINFSGEILTFLF